jgi:hypothetical protein
MNGCKHHGPVSTTRKMSELMPRWGNCISASEIRVVPPYPLIRYPWFTAAWKRKLENQSNKWFISFKMRAKRERDVTWWNAAAQTCPALDLSSFIPIPMLKFQNPLLSYAREKVHYKCRQAWELISGPCLGTKARLLSFNRMQSRVVTGLLTRHNTLRRHLHLMGLIYSPLCRKCGAKDEASAHILCRYEALALLRHVYLGSLFLEPQNIKNVSLGAIWNFGKVTGLP